MTEGVGDRDDSLAEFLAASPLRDSEFVVERSHDPGRRVDLSIDDAEVKEADPSRRQRFAEAIRSGEAFDFDEAALDRQEHWQAP